MGNYCRDQVKQIVDIKVEIFINTMLLNRILFLLDLENVFY